MPIEVGREQFERYVAEAVEALPPEFLDRISNLDFSVEEWARAEDFARTRSPRGSTLLGVYRGIPLDRRGRGYGMVVPDHIVIFRGPLQRLARDEQDLADRIAHVVRHEVAHHFGISDERLREIDAY
jgi:predicted Zn-dependent protease with MMP-like domain